MLVARSGGGTAAWVFDLDGTPADVKHRQHLAPGKGVDRDQVEAWAAYNGARVADPRVWPVYQLLLQAYDAGLSIALVSGRNDTAWDGTVTWLEANDIPWHALALRDRGDVSPNGEYKAKRLDWLEAAGYDVSLWVDDYEAVAAAVGDRVPVLLVKNAEFDRTMV